MHRIARIVWLLLWQCQTDHFPSMSNAHIKAQEQNVKPSKKRPTCRERSCFSKPCPSNINPSCVRFGKLQAEYSPLAVPNQTSSRFRMVSFDVICLKTDISTTTWAGVNMYFDFVLTHLEHQMGRVHCMEAVWKMVTTLNSIIQSQLLSCNCLRFHIMFQSHPTGSCIG